MHRGQARLLDLTFGFCIPDVTLMIGIVLWGSFDTLTDNRFSARWLDSVYGLCGHSAFIITGSLNTYIDHFPAARWLDFHIGPFIGIIITASNKKFVN